MIIEIPDDNSIIKWKYNDNDAWKIAEISDLIKAYEERPKDCEACKHIDKASTEYPCSVCKNNHRNMYEWRGNENEKAEKLP